MSTYNVQFLVVKEVQVEATDDLQAEKLAFAELEDSGAAIALCVLEREGDEGGGALRSEESYECWKFAKKCFHPIDLDWVQK